MTRQAHTSIARNGVIPIFALFAANAISMTGNVLAVIAIPWFVLQTTGSAIRWVLIALGAFCLVTTLSLLVNPAIREMDQVSQTTRVAATSPLAGE